MSKIEWLVVVAIVLILAMLIAPAIDRVAGDRVSVGGGVVLGKSYVPATHSTGVGYAYGRGGGPVVVSNSSREKWVVIVRHEGETFSLDVDADTWASVQEGSEVEVFEIRGAISNWGKTINP